MIVSSSITKEKSAMRMRTSYAAIVAIAIVMVCLSVGSSFAQLFNYNPYPSLALNRPSYYAAPGAPGSNSDGGYLVPNYLPGGERYFLVPVFIKNPTDPTKNPNTKDGTWKSDDQRILGVDGQYLVPIRSFEFQIHYPNQAITIDNDPAHGSPIVTVGPDKNLATAQALAAPFYIRYTEQSANDTTNPFHRIIRITGSSEVPLPLTPNVGSGPNVYPDSEAVLLYVRFKIIQNWTVNTTALQLDSAKFADHVGDYQYDPANYTRGNFYGYQNFIRGYLPVYITDLPAFELRPFIALNSTDNKNYDLLRTLVFDPTDVTQQNPLINLQVRDAIPSTRLVNVNICTDQPWLFVGLTGNNPQHCVYIQKIDYPGSISSDEKQLFISANPSGLAPGIYYGYVTLTADGAANSPTRIKVTFVVRGQMDEPTAGSGSGIHVSITNSCSPTCTRNLVFGTAKGATDGIDLLYGEDLFTDGDKAAALSNLDSTKRCYAYFEPMHPESDTAFANPSNLGTIRDIRSDRLDTSLQYKVVFGSGGPLCYPVTICMDPADFPEGSRVIVRDVLNGSLFSFNMREATPVGNTRCIVIRDPSINSFIIEYTPGSKGQTADLVKQAWNLISLPVVPPNPASNVIFPNSTGTPFSYASNAGWTAANQLEFGRGYMIHYGTVVGTDNLVSGVRSNTVANVRMHAGWNTVGGVSFPVCTNPNFSFIFFTPVPGGSGNPQRQSDYFEYVPGGGYEPVGYIKPGHGYFVKVSDESFYNINMPEPNVSCKLSADATEMVRAELAKVTVRDAAQNGQSLYFGHSTLAQSNDHYEMPPAMTDFDARFAENNGSLVASGNEHIVKIASNNYPVSMNFENVSGIVEVRDLSGNVIGSVSGNGTVLVRDASVKQVVLALKSGASEASNGFALESSYPNPAGAVTVFNYTVPAESFVTITLTNALGQEVSKLVNTTVSAGRHEVKIDGSNLAEGTYFYTIHAGNFTQTQKLTIAH